MNQLSLNARTIKNDEQLIIDGIEFSHAILIALIIDSIPSEKMKYLDIALVLFSELVRSLSGNGCYLIFTSASGIADEGGWEGVQVEFDGDRVVWDFEVEDETYHFEFDSQQYEREIRSLESKLVALTKEFDLEPAEVFFPETWESIRRINAMY